MCGSCIYHRRIYDILWRCGMAAGGRGVALYQFRRGLCLGKWKKSGDDWFWLDSDGEMAVSSLIEDGDDHYYVNSAGSMVKNQWRELDNTDNSDDEADTCWYYFGPNGKAYKAASSGKTTFKTITNGEGITRRYAFDTEGRMLYGWVDEGTFE